MNVKRKPEESVDVDVLQNPAKKAKTEHPPALEIHKLSSLDHVLYGSDMYIGQSCYSMSPQVSRFVYNRQSQLMEYRNLTYPNGLLKLFDEALVNAADNRHKGTKTIKVGINVLQNAIYIFNDGANFKIIETPHDSLWSPTTAKAYQPELAFFHLKSSSAYGKTQRITGGKYGLGAKLIACFSTQCTIEMCDGETYYYQKSADHLHNVYAPTIRPANKKELGKPYLAICFSPDLSLFYPKNAQGQSTAPNILSDDMINLFLTRVIDIAGTTQGSLQVYWSLNTDKFIAPKLCDFEKIPIKSFKDYVKLFIPPELKAELDSSDEKLSVASHSEPRWEVCLIRNPWPQPMHVSFVNNINTYLGGEHVKYLQQQVYQFCKLKVEGVDLRRVQNLVMLFVNATIEDPSFSSQTKEFLQTNPSTFGSKCELPPKFLNTLTRNGVIEALKSNMETKEIAQARKAIGAGKRKPVHSIPHFRDAKFAGSRKSQDCTLYFVEGASAMELAEVGLSILGTDYNGAFALKGKVINAEKSVTTLQKNKEFVNICRALGLELGKPTPLSQLRYGRVVILTDQDCDGSHISGLILHIFSTFWPHLLKERNFLVRMITPIVVARKGKATEYFYTLQAFQSWHDALSDNQRKVWQIKYYKGLGTSTSKEGRYYFKHLREHLRNFAQAEASDLQALDLVFGKNNAHKRKEWLKVYETQTFIAYDHIAQLSIQDFIHKDLKHYSWMSVERAIPMCDGLSGAARKCIWVMLKRNVTKDVKVNILQSQVDKDTNYHHGSNSLGNTLVRLAQNFVGKQNINVLVPSGQFGTRIDGGKTHAATRYIFTRLCPITRYIYRAEDDAILTLQQDEGKTIEPVILAPIIPMVLVNGVCGIATGFATDIPCYKPEDLIQALRQKLVHGQAWPTTLRPWYHKFQGAIQGDDKGNFESSGVVTQKQPHHWHITELPLGKWREAYKTFLTKLMDDGEIKEFHEQHRDENVHFEVVTKPDAKIENPEQFFKLKSRYLSQLNLIIEDPDTVGRLKIKTFTDIAEILEYWYAFRLKLYETRRVHLLQTYQKQIPFLQAKLTFIRMILNQQIPLGQKRQALCEKLTAHHIPDEFHESLLRMRIQQFSEEKIQETEKELADTQKQIVYYTQVNPKDLWLQDLTELEQQLPDFWASRILKDEEEEEDHTDDDDD